MFFPTSGFLENRLERIYSHASRTSGCFPPFLHAFDLALAVCLSLAYHIVIIEGFTSCTYEEGGAEERSGAGTEFFDLGDGVWQWGRVDQNLLIESVGSVSYPATKIMI